MKKNLILLSVVFAAVGLNAPTFAQGVDPQIEGAKLCTRNLARYERQYGIPMHLLSAISATESGRYHDGLKLTLPWPWTINVEGKGHYYDSKEQAIAAVRRYQLQGARSIDVGCMQVSLLHHPDAFANLEDAFNPEHNVAYGASFLRGLYEESKSWKKASADYHSKTPARGTEYVGRVYDRWATIVGRLREAKMAVPEATVAALGEKELPARPVELTRADDRPVPVRAQKMANAKTPRVKLISVSNAEAAPRDPRDNGVLVIRPKITVVDDALTVARNAPAAAEIPALAPVTSRVIHVADTRPIQPVAMPSGPRFIFDN